MKKIVFKRRLYILIAILIVVTTSLILSNFEQFPKNVEYIYLDPEENITHQTYLQSWLELKHSYTNLSKLGRILFLDEQEPTISTKKTYQILLWKYGATIEARHMRNFSNKTLDPFRHCPVKNCEITYKDASVSTADIVIFHLHRMKSEKELPQIKRRPEQIWAFLTDESPYHTFLTSKAKLSAYDGVFNWSMTYRSDSDIPVPYGRTILKKNPANIDLYLNKRRDVLVAILGSNCGGKNNRWDYVRELQKHMRVDVYGKCGPLKTCPGHFKEDCPDLEEYLFYLSFENSNCDDYLTEKLWWNAYSKNSIPIVMGSNQANYKKQLPPDSYIHVEDFASPAVLAQFILRLNETNEYKNYFKWKRYYDVVNEHGYFKSESFHYCRICQALNYNDKKPKVYEKLDDFWSVQKNCYPPWNAG